MLYTEDHYGTRLADPNTEQQPIELKKNTFISTEWASLYAHDDEDFDGAEIDFDDFR